jgi:hypothetical protein
MEKNKGKKIAMQSSYSQGCMAILKKLKQIDVFKFFYFVIFQSLTWSPPIGAKVRCR